MTPRVRTIPTYRERSALQTSIEKGWLSVARLYPAGPATIAGMLSKGWLQRKRGATSGWMYHYASRGDGAKGLDSV
jgi:hypothetical protein